MAAAALKLLHETNETTMAALQLFRHMKIYELLRIDVNIHYMLGQLYILQREPADNKAHIHVIMTELSKFGHQRELELKLNTCSFPELDRLRVYNRRTRTEPNIRNNGNGTGSGSESWAYTPLVVKHTLCRNVLCSASTSCMRFHGTYTDHLLYLRRCSYKLMPAPDQHVCGDTCAYYHTESEREYWESRYSALTD